MIVAAPLLPFRLQVFAITVLALFLGWVLWLIRKRKLSLTESLSWFLTTFAVMVVTIFPQILVSISHLLAIEIPVNAVFTLAFLYVGWNLLTLTLTSSTQTVRLRRVTQECAMLRAELEALKRQQTPDQGRSIR